MTTPHTPDVAGTPPRRMTLSDVVDRLLTRGSAAGSSVTLTRNAKGETQIEVVVRTDPDQGIDTPADATAVAGELFDRLRTAYPFGADHAA